MVKRKNIVKEEKARLDKNAHLKQRHSSLRLVCKILLDHEMSETKSEMESKTRFMISYQDFTSPPPQRRRKGAQLWCFARCALPQWLRIEVLWIGEFPILAPSAVASGEVGGVGATHNTPSYKWWNWSSKTHIYLFSAMFHQVILCPKNCKVLLTSGSVSLTCISLLKVVLLFFFARDYHSFIFWYSVHVCCLLFCQNHPFLQFAESWDGCGETFGPRPNH